MNTVLYFVVITRQFNQLISKFSSLCNKFTSVWSKFSCNTSCFTLLFQILFVYTKKVECPEFASA